MVLLAPVIGLYLVLSMYELETAYYIYRACEAVVGLGRVVAGLAYSFGVMATVGLLVSSLLLFTGIVCTELGLPMPRLQGFYGVATRIASHPATWGAVTAIIGTTVALCHLKNLKVNEERHYAETRARWKAEEKEKQERL